MSEKKSKYLSQALSKAAFPLPLLHRMCLQNTMSLLGPGPVTCSLALSLALLPSQSCQRSQTRCCFCWVGSLLFLLAEGSQMVQLWWL